MLICSVFHRKHNYVLPVESQSMRNKHLADCYLNIKTESYLYKSTTFTGNLKTRKCWLMYCIADLFSQKVDTYKLTVKASDLNGRVGGNTGTGEIVIRIMDINDNIPTLEKDSVGATHVTQPSLFLFSWTAFLKQLLVFAVWRQCGGEHHQCGSDEDQSPWHGSNSHRQLAGCLRNHYGEWGRLFQYHYG